MNKNELIITASEEESSYKKDGYISAIMYKYWNKIDSYYYKCKLVITPEDAHTWLVKSLMYAIEHKAWQDPDSTIYQDPTGPDKVINKYMECARLTFYQQLNRYKRKINGAIRSLDSLTEEYKDVFSPYINDDYTIEYDEMVVEYFNKEDYFMAFFIDALLYEDVYNEDGLSNRKISLHFHSLDTFYCEMFAFRYSLTLKNVIEANKTVKNLSSYNMKKNIEYNTIRLQKRLKGE